MNLALKNSHARWLLGKVSSNDLDSNNFIYLSFNILKLFNLVKFEFRLLILEKETDSIKSQKYFT